MENPIPLRREQKRDLPIYSTRTSPCRVRGFMQSLRGKMASSGGMFTQEDYNNRKDGSSLLSLCFAMYYSKKTLLPETSCLGIVVVCIGGMTSGMKHFKFS